MDTTAKSLRRLRVTVVLCALVAATVICLASASVAGASVLPPFCSTCHQMRGGATTWHAGAHKGLACTSCHVPPSSEPRFRHKLIALKAIRDHLLGKPTFPLPPIAIPPISDSKCMGCHPKVPDTLPGFSHAQHARGRQCVRCHDAAGHSLTEPALARLNPAGLDRTSIRVVAHMAPITVASAQHPNVACSDCHDLTTTPCESCHALPLKHAATSVPACSTCHSAGGKWLFQHPTRADCQTCHTTPANHVTTSEACVLCHTAGPKSWKSGHAAPVASCDSCHVKPAAHRPGTCTTCHRSQPVSWAFSHPSSTDCATCHNRPANHRAGACTTCHRSTAAGWKFTHPGSANCAGCHNRPANHRAGACASCHRVSASWKYSHPGASNCASCHNRPAKHRAGACVSCHRSAGTSWRFTHPRVTNCGSCHNRPAGHRSGSCASCHRNASWRFYHTRSTRCASCHSAPANHYGTTCASCHSPSRAWTNATLHHPSAGEHSYRSFACTKCHPSGPPRVYCTCHNGRPPTGD